ncbi:hypothetical protein [Haloactinomyces albus]|uniref:Uncharacterized protein n=1 Tax=Haloactinomyces albus TaxID=1352928 RepID=A0AAE3ZBH8_9ACTN|nr:hypothetical protein [Haloactinomyces albus]MDR7300616.1 hypothetical protein [Haloactinomyces albus]
MRCCSAISRQRLLLRARLRELLLDLLAATLLAFQRVVRIGEFRAGLDQFGAVRIQVRVEPVELVALGRRGRIGEHIGLGTRPQRGQQQVVLDEQAEVR